jgi:hypothetical protein
VRRRARHLTCSVFGEEAAMAGTIDSTIERKRDKKKNEQARADEQEVAESGGPGEGDASTTKNERGDRAASKLKAQRIGSQRKTLDH